MEFRTEYEPSPSEEAISLRKPILMLGSCFADNIGAELRRRMVRVSVNPTGTLFNPMSIAAVANAALDGCEPEYEEHDGLWNSWLLPTEFSSPDRETAQRLGADALRRLKSDLNEAGTIIITLGTAIVYALARPPFTVVSNCHKRPASTFLRDMLPPEAIASTIDALVDRIRRTNPEARFIFTVSPVRHLREGFHANTLSKSALHLALAQVCGHNARCSYFPAYEIMIDDLRDYRFCAADMAHPSQKAVEYIYAKFAETYFTPGDRTLLDRALQLRRRLEHRPLHPDTEASRRFAAETPRLLADLSAKAPFLRVEEERK